MTDNTQNEKHCVKCTQFWTGGSMSSHCIDGENHEWSDTLTAENERLKKQLDIAMKALDHYAQKRIWKEVDVSESGVASTFETYRGDDLGYTVAQQSIEDVEKVK